MLFPANISCYMVVDLVHSRCLHDKNNNYMMLQQTSECEMYTCGYKDERESSMYIIYLQDLQAPQNPYSFRDCAHKTKAITVTIRVGYPIRKDVLRSILMTRTDNTMLCTQFTQEGCPQKYFDDKDRQYHAVYTVYSSCRSS